VAISFLTRLRMPIDGQAATERDAAAAWAYPLAGALVGAIGGGLYWLLESLGVPAGPAAGLALAAMLLTTGGLHEDGLADLADGLGGGWTRERRLEIMRDSRIGAFGALTLMVALLIKWSALTEFNSAEALAALVAAGAISRAPLGAAMRWLHHARADGLSRHVGRPPALSAGLGLALGLAAPLLVLGVYTGAAGAFAGLVLAGATLSLARVKLGGQTGDVLGATQQVSELAVLVVLAAAL
jgi:adenosylcobinamide-GDP ribazoletransferase